jgi:hypothetical protein
MTRALTLTNHLIGTAQAIEVHVIADRVSLVHRALMPALYALVRRGRDLLDLAGLSLYARDAFTLLRQRGEVTAGDVRRHLGLRASSRDDPVHAALAELEGLLLVDRGPFEIPRSGIPYLSRTGYPYHLFHEAHPDLVRDAARLSLAQAADTFLLGYLDGAVFAATRKLASMFRAFLPPREIEAALERLARKQAIAVHEVGRTALAISRGT